MGKCFLEGIVLRIDYALTRKDLWNSSVNGLLFKPQNLLILILCVFMFGILIGMSKQELIIYIIFCVVSYPIFYLACSLFNIYSGKIRHGVIGDHIIEISEKGFVEITSVNNTFNSWDFVKSIKNTKKYIYIEMLSSSRYQIPKRAFNSTDEAGMFYHEAMLSLNSWNGKSNQIKTDVPPESIATDRNNRTVLDQIKELSKMKDDAILTEEEFLEKKRVLLAKIN